jgi:membrane associated rhomboid family serine protease
MTPWVLRLILANGAVFLLQSTLPWVTSAFWFVPVEAVTRPWTIVTYMFLHGGLGHIFFNMLALLFFGQRVELRLGARNFLTLYAVSGITGALLSIPFAPRTAIVGASGAVFGVLLAFARYWPRDQVLIWGVFPVEARWLVAGMTVLALLGGFTGGGGIAHFAHLGGFLGGWLALKAFEQRSPARRFRARTMPTSSREPPASALARWRRIRRDELHEVNRAELDRILDKISTQGIDSLTPGDREFLERFSAREGM